MPSQYRAGAFGALVGSVLYNEAREVAKQYWRGRRRQFSNYLLGSPYSYRIPYRRSYELRNMRWKGSRPYRRATGAQSLASIRRARALRSRRLANKRKRITGSNISSARRRLGTNGPAFRTVMRPKKGRMELGEPMGYMPSKKHGYHLSVNNHPDKSLASVPLVKIPYSDADELMNVRHGRLVDVRGVKFRAWFSLKANQIESWNGWDEPIQFRWAIINPKDQLGDQSIDINAGKNWFVSSDPGADDAFDFPATGNCFKYMNRAINRRKYDVLQQGSFLLQNDPASTNTRVASSSKKLINFWLPINRQMKFANNTTTYPNANVYFVYWYVKQGDKDDAVAIPGGAVDFLYEHITYFRTPQVLN